MFENVALAPPDPILGITEAFKKDTREGKINLSVGVYEDEAGKTPVLASVKAAEKRLLETEATKGYKPIDGDPTYGRLVRETLFGAGHEYVSGERAATLHTPGGTGALRLSADFLSQKLGVKKIWVSNPTWANHQSIFGAAGISSADYAYYDPETKGLAFSKLLADLNQVGAGEAVLLHACCHNPSGADPTAEQWKEISALLKAKGALPVLDFAYQGFGDGLVEDAVGLRALSADFEELLVCSSYSKNFGLYNERVGALTVTAKSKEQRDSVLSQLKICVRTNFSNPPAHGGAIVSTILGDEALRAQWEKELAEMRSRIARMRVGFVEGLRAAGVPGDFSFITRQKGMFSFSGLTKAQVDRLKDEHAIYVVGSGRINVAGMTPKNLPILCQAIASVSR